MKTAFICPTAYLDAVASKGDMHLVLAQHVLNNEAYREFYRKEEKYKILDNGAFELGHPLPLEDILQAAELIGAHEVVAPDVFRDGHKTIDAVNNFVCQVHALIPAFKRKEYHFKTMAVPHGKDFVDWFQCFQELYDNGRIDVIGVGYQSCKAMQALWPQELSLSALRVRLVKALTATFPNKPIHLLGGGTNPIEILHYKELSQVRSIDSKLPFVAGMMRQRFDSEIGWVRPGEPVLDFKMTDLDSQQTTNVDWNIGVMRMWAKNAEEA